MIRKLPGSIPSGELPAPVFALALEHPSGVFRRQCADAVERGQFFRVQAEGRGRDVVVELFHFFGADHDARHNRLVEQPRDRHPGDRYPVPFGYGPHGVDAIEGPLPIHRREIERRPSCIGRRRDPPSDFSSETP